MTRFIGFNSLAAENFFVALKENIPYGRIRAKAVIEMAVSEAQKLAKTKYREEKRDQITAEVPKGKRDAYKMIAAEKNMSLSMLIQTAVETFARDTTAKSPAQPAAEKLSADERQLVEEFAKLPADVRKAITKIISAVNSSKGGGKNGNE